MANSLYCEVSSEGDKDKDKSCRFIGTWCVFISNRLSLSQLGTGSLVRHVDVQGSASTLARTSRPVRQRRQRFPTVRATGPTRRRQPPRRLGSLHEVRVQPPVGSSKSRADAFSLVTGMIQGRVSRNAS